MNNKKRQNENMKGCPTNVWSLNNKTRLDQSNVLDWQVSSILLKI